MKGKQGKGHVEVIISFVLFVGFLSFIFLAFNPLQGSQSSTLVDSVFNSLEQNLTRDLSRISLSISADRPITGSCFSVDNNFILSETKGLNCQDPRNLLVRDKDEQEVVFELSLTNIDVATSSAGKFYTFYCSEELPSTSNSLSGCDNIEEENYSLGIIVKNDHWSNTSITTLESQYKSSYDSIKNSFVRDVNDFGFIVWDLQGNRVHNATQFIPSGVDVNAKTIPIDIVDSNATVKKHTVTVIAW